MLRDSGFQDNVEYVLSRMAIKSSPKRSHARRITWFNPPYNQSVKTRTGQRLLRLIDRNFPVGFELHKTFNRSTVKVSYSCMPNMGTITRGKKFSAKMKCK